MTTAAHGATFTSMRSTVEPSQAGGDARQESTHASIARGSAIGRYIVLSRVGAGGMGVVYAAYDPELDRRVAIKLLRSDRSGSPNALARVLREAQAMARLNHPNVVALHDVGEHDDSVFLAMEFVEGLTLAQWREVAAPGRRELLAVMQAAGEGLAAAHDKGLVHRDFKPDNVMIGDDGRVRVMDFGLARGGSSDGAGNTREDEHERPAAEVLSAALTRHGAIVGTPGYMAPEQYTSGPIGAAADQFAFCVTLYEALFGERPFDGASASGLLRATMDGPRDGSRHAAVPRWLQRVILRGLAADPAERWPSMRALLDALRRDPTPRRLGIVGVAAVVAIAGGSMAYAQWRETSRTRACAEVASELEVRWGSSAAAVREAMRATGLPHAGATFERTRERIDAFVTKWAEAREQLCLRDEPEARPVNDEPDEALACLQDRAAELGELVDALSSPTHAIVDDAIAASAAMTSPERCLSPEGTATETRAGDPAAREVRDLLARASARRWVSDNVDAAALADAAMTKADALGIDTLRAQARYELGGALIQRNELARAEVLLREAFALAATSGADGVASDSAQALVYVLSIDTARHREAELWAELCGIYHDRLRLPADDPRRASLRSEVGMLRYAQGRLAESREEYRKAIAIFERTTIPDDPAALGAQGDLAMIDAWLGDLAAADTRSARVVEAAAAAFGPDHPRAALALVSRSEVLRMLGRHEEALVAARRVLAIRERSMAPDSEDVAAALMAVARLLPPTAERREQLLRALTIFERTRGPGSQPVTMIEQLLAQ